MSVPDPSVLPPNLPVPDDDGAADHLPGTRLPPVRLPASNGAEVLVGEPSGRTLIFCYPHIGEPGAALPADWDLIPGARGCTTEACGFRDWYAESAELDVQIFGVSTDDSAYQQKCVERLALPFPLVSDSGLELASAWRLPLFEAEGRVYLKRLTMLMRDGVVERVWYPVFPPDRHAAEVFEAIRE
jgi:peroxiredoxin